MAPAVGGPASVAKAQIVPTIPNRMPIFRGSLVKLARAPTNMPWVPPLTNPKKALKMYMPVLSRTPIQPKTVALSMKLATMYTLIGPT